MQAYALHDLSLVLENDSGQPPAELEQLLEDLSFITREPSSDAPTLRLSVRPAFFPVELPRKGRETLCAEGFRGVEHEGDFYLTDGNSSVHVRPARGTAEAYVAPTFFSKPQALQRNFWAFVLMKLLRARGVFTLHAAALTSPQGVGLLIVAHPGSGKSTLAIGLVRCGWGYLSDDAILLRRSGECVEALALRRHFYVDAAVYDRYTDLNPGMAVGDVLGEQRHQINIHHAFPEQYMHACVPRIVLFPRIDRHRNSQLESIETAGATSLLLRESGPQLFDRSHMAEHLSVLRGLTEQCDLFHLRSGPDLYANPGALASLLSPCMG